VSAFIEIFSTTDGRLQSMQSASKPWTRLRSTFGEFGDDEHVCLVMRKEWCCTTAGETREIVQG